MHPADPFIDRTILGGQFHLTKKIGTGGMGSVYQAIQVDMNRPVAIKILHPKLATRKDLASRFRREARAMSQLTHPNTVKVFMYGQLEEGGAMGGLLYIVMEYLEGRNLNRAVKREGPLSLERAVAILIQVCGALQEAHNEGIVHRDLKPENIFLCRQGEYTDYPKVLDFGLAKVTERQMRPGSIQLTQEGMVFGTPEFMSPEQAQGKTLDARSDIYSLAVILYEALTGKLPFDARTPMEYIQKHVLEPPIPINQRIPDLHFPEGVWQAIARALAKSPADRFQSAMEFGAALRPYVGTATALVDSIFKMAPTPNFVTPAASIEPPAPAPPPAPVAIPPPSSRRGSAGSARPSIAVMVLVAVVFLLLGAGIALVLVSILSK
jgi:eukaryotic-like serine/threonine-protein kinase